MLQRRRRSGSVRSPITAKNIGRVQRKVELERELEEHVKRNDGLYDVLTAISKLDADEKATARRLTVPGEDGSSKSFESAIIDYYVKQEDTRTTYSGASSIVSEGEFLNILDQISGDEMDVFSEIISLNETETSSSIKDAVKQSAYNNALGGVSPDMCVSEGDLQGKRLPVKRRNIKSAMRKKSDHNDAKTAVTFQNNAENEIIHVQYPTTGKHIQMCRPNSADCPKNSSKEHKHYLRQESDCSTMSKSETSEVGNRGSSYSNIARRKISSGSKESILTNDSHGHKSVNFDPELDKATKYLHGGGGKTFSRTNKNLVPMKYGLKHIQMSYTEANLEHNPSIVFMDLLKSSQQTNHIRYGGIRNIEKRLESRRQNPLYYTSFYEHKQLVDPFHRQTKSGIRTVAQKKKARKEKIKKMTDELHTGYVPTHLTMKIAEQDEVEDIGRKVRYLRCNAPAQIDG